MVCRGVDAGQKPCVTRTVEEPCPRCEVRLGERRPLDPAVRGGTEASQRVEVGAQAILVHAELHRVDATAARP